MNRVDGKKRERRKNGTVPPSRVWGVRADLPFWERAEEQAAKEEISRNALIVKAVEFYLEINNGEK